MKNPQIIGGGMGVGVSTWRQAQTLALLGCLGNISGTIVEIVMARTLQLGDLGGHWQRALTHFPVPGVAGRILEKYYIEGGKKPEDRFKAVPVFDQKPNTALVELTVAANFAQVWLAQRNLDGETKHDGLVGINLLTKVEMPQLFALFGAMLAGVDVVSMGAGIPVQIPGILDGLAKLEKVSYRLDVENADKADKKEYLMEFDPRAFLGENLTLPDLKRPKFFAIISLLILARVLMNRKKTSGKVDGFIVENWRSGGHNAPPRDHKALTDDGQPDYDETKDSMDFAALKELCGKEGWDVPWWVAGSWASPERLQEAKSLGAQGIQVGSILALSDESGFEESLKAQLRRLAFRGELDVRRNPRVSPTGFPFMVADLPGSLADPCVYAARPRACDLRRLATLYAKDDGSLGFRCPAEEIDQFVRKGGNVQDTCERVCLCNDLLAAIGLGQTMENGKPEPPILTIGLDLSFIPHLMEGENDSYSVKDVVEWLLPQQS